MDYAALMIIGIMVAMLVAYTEIEHWWFLKKRKEKDEYNRAVCDRQSCKLD